MPNVRSLGGGVMLSGCMVVSAVTGLDMGQMDREVCCMAAA